ncbi:Stress response protein SCP2 [Paenibacillus algorifonticola]|uniref:Stress response protein SCP2 n=1 Tax=Paenibacillus algorifonticola TaxID=684063 RepID=A0A1I2FID8_9BACL|nr:TerD family protein [Paenibacillus algorifonticola]SFF05172.1 Stress response protein SCP2 [Paenibacillus algorifonticola]
MILTKGQKIDVTKGRGISDVVIGLSWQTADAAIDINASAFLLNQAGVCAQDEDMIFYNQPFSRQHAVTHAGPVNGDQEHIKISVGKVPSDIHKIAVTLTIHEGELHGQAFSQVRGAVGRIYNPINGEEIGRFNFGEGLSIETAIVVGEFYLHKGEWKFNAVGSGFEGGLADLVRNFGLKVSSESHVEAAAAAEPAAVPAKPSQLLKVELKKKESINIQKSAKVTATLEWQTDRDLDLYCFYVTKDREVGKVYYRNLGSKHIAPYIQLDGDAMGQGKETIVIHRPEALSFVLFAAYSAISNGSGSFRSMEVRAVVENHQGHTVTAPLLEENNYAYWVAIVHIDFTDAKQMRVSHVEKYSNDGVERSPLLYEKGDFKMDVGPEEFKDDWD